MFNSESTSTSILPRLLFIVTKFYQFRKLLKNYLNINSNKVVKQYNLPNNLIFTVNKLIELNLHDLYAQGIRVLILDYDGVLSAHGEVTVSVQVMEWLRQAVLIFGSQRVFVLSNNPLSAREEFFNRKFSNAIVFINKQCLTRPKPYPDGVWIILSYLSIKPISKLDDKVNANHNFVNNYQLVDSITKSQILLIDDRLSSGILAAGICGLSGCLIKRPYTNLKKHFIIELGFIFIRKLERAILWHLW